MRPPAADGSLASAAVLVIGRGAAEQQISELARTYPVVVLVWHSRDLRAWLASQAGEAPAPGDRPPVICAGDLEVDLHRHRVRLGTTEVAVTEQELKLLAVLAEDPERAWTFDELAERVWGYDFTDGSEVRSAVKRLRRKLGTAQAGDLIASVRGVGFRLTSPRRPAPELPQFWPPRRASRN